MKRYYVGHIAGKLTGEVFTATEKPTATTHPQYTRATGPFRTKRAAVFATRYLVTFSTIAECERMAKHEELRINAMAAVTSILGPELANVKR